MEQPIQIPEGRSIPRTNDCWAVALKQGKMKGGQMCWICERLEKLITVWNEEREFQEQTSSDDYHRGLFKGLSECVRDLSDALSSMRLKGVCEKFTRHESSLDDEERLQILNDLLKLRDENGRQE